MWGERIYRELLIIDKKKFTVNFGKNLSSLSFYWILMNFSIHHQMGCFTILMQEFSKFWYFLCFPGLHRRVKTQKSPKNAIFQLWGPKKGQKFQDIKNSCLRVFYTHMRTGFRLQFRNLKCSGTISGLRIESQPWSKPWSQPWSKPGRHKFRPGLRPGFRFF